MRVPNDEMYGGNVRNFFKLAGLLFAAAFLLAACSDDGGDDADGIDTESTVEVTVTETPTEPATATETTESTATATGTTAAEGETVEITGVDYAFEGVPETAEVGTELTFTNASEVEAHEMLMFQLPEGETRTVEELLALPETEAQEIVGPPIGVAVALPGEDGEVVEGELVAAEAGRYVLLCFIPTGADPEAIAEAMQNPTGEAPQVEGGPPHAAQGMYAEFTVE